MKNPCTHDYDNPTRKGRAHYLCPKCDEDISLLIMLVESAAGTGEYTCRFHPTDWWHEEGCPHTISWQQLIENLYGLDGKLDARFSVSELVASITDILAAERIALKDEIDRISTENPERESDEYDRGMKDFKEKVLGLLD